MSNSKDALKAMLEGRMNNEALKFMEKQNKIEDSNKKDFVDNSKTEIIKRKREERLNEAKNLVKTSEEYYVTDDGEKEPVFVPTDAIQNLLSGKKDIAMQTYGLEKQKFKKLTREELLKENSSIPSESETSVSKEEIKSIIYEMLENYKKERLKPLFKEIFKEIISDMKSKK